MLGVAFEFKDKPDTTTPYTATNMNNMQKLLVDLIYPVGTYYETSDSNFDPNTAWGGTWKLDQSGTVLVSKSNASGSKFNASIGTTVGEEEHTLIVDEMPSHTHGVKYRNIQISTGNTYTNELIDSSNVTATTSVGGGQAHNNVQPSKIINRWHRTA